MEKSATPAGLAAPDRAASPPPPAAIRCRGLRKTYDGKVEAVRGLDLEIRQGECFGLLGPNGAGKTTTIEMLEGLLQPSGGEMEILGQSWAGAGRRLRQQLGISLQETRLSEKLTVRETLRLFASFYAEARRPERVMAELELDDKAEARVGKLSGGQRQRLAVATALVGNPRLLFLDEPTTGLDPQSRRQLWEVVRRFTRAGGTVLLTTHYMDEAERLCDRLAIVDQGRIIAEGAPRELIHHLGGEHVIEAQTAAPAPELAEICRRIPGAQAVWPTAEGCQLQVQRIEDSLPELLWQLQARGIALARLSTRSTSLEDVFVQLTGRQLRQD